MKNYILTIFILLVSLELFSQDSLSNTSLEKAKYLTEKLSRDLTVKDDQKKQLFNILHDRSSQIAEFNQLERNAYLLKIEEINNQTIERLTKVLTPEQMSLYRKLRQASSSVKDKYKQRNSNYFFTKEDIELDF
jgi:hypothetical protein